jgi:WD40 repeat protein
MAGGEHTMTQHKHRKALIRARMARTGEAYTAARRHIVALERAIALTPAGAFRAHDRHCQTAVFTPDDRHLLSGGFGGEARIWTLAGERLGELVGHESSVNVILVSRDGSLVVTASSDRTVRTWDLPARRQRAVLGRHRSQVLGLALDEAHGRVWSGGQDRRLSAWDVATGEGAGTIDVGAPVTSVAVRADGLVAASTVGGGISVRDPDGAEVTRLAADTDASTSVTWASDGGFVLAAASGRALVWSSDDWRLVRTIDPGGDGLWPIALSPDGSRVALGWHGHIGLWGPDQDAPAVTVDGLPRGVYGLRFSNDGCRLAMAAADGRVRLWDVA